MKECNPKIPNANTPSECPESYQGLSTHTFLVLERDGIKVTAEDIEKIASEKGVSVSDIGVIIVEELSDYLSTHKAILRPTDAPSLDELTVRYHLQVPQLHVPFDREDNRPWYNKYDKKGKRRR